MTSSTFTYRSLRSHRSPDQSRWRSVRKALPPRVCAKGRTVASHQRLNATVVVSGRAPRRGPRRSSPRNAAAQLRRADPSRPELIEGRRLGNTTLSRSHSTRVLLGNGGRRRCRRRRWRSRRWRGSGASLPHPASSRSSDQWPYASPREGNTQPPHP